MLDPDASLNNQTAASNESGAMRRVKIELVCDKTEGVGSKNMLTSPVRMLVPSGVGLDDVHGSMVPDDTYSNCQVSPIVDDTTPSSTTRFWSVGFDRYVARCSATKFVVVFRSLRETYASFPYALKPA